MTSAVCVEKALRDDRFINWRGIDAGPVASVVATPGYHVSIFVLSDPEQRHHPGYAELLSGSTRSGEYGGVRCQKNVLLLTGSAKEGNGAIRVVT